MSRAGTIYQDLYKTLGPKTKKIVTLTKNIDKGLDKVDKLKKKEKPKERPKKCCSPRKEVKCGCSSKQPVTKPVDAKMEFKRQYIITYMATWAANNYVDACQQGKHESLADWRIMEEASTLADAAWESYQNLGE